MCDTHLPTESGSRGNVGTAAGACLCVMVVKRDVAIGRWCSRKLSHKSLLVLAECVAFKTDGAE